MEAEKFNPSLKGADYLGIVKVVLTGDDEADSEGKVDELTVLLDANGTSATPEPSQSPSTDPTATRRRLQVAEGRDFKYYAQQCMYGGQDEEDGDFEECGGFLGLDLPNFESLVSICLSFCACSESNMNVLCETQSCLWT